MAVKKVGTLIREARTAKKLSQEQLASGIDGLSGSDIGKAERGEKDLSQAQLKAIAKALGVTQKSLLEAPKGGSPAPAASKTAAASKTGTASKTTSAAKTTASKTSAAKKTATSAKTASASKTASTAAKKTSSTTSKKTASGTASKPTSTTSLSAAEQKLIELYRAADSDDKKLATRILKGEKLGIADLIPMLMANGANGEDGLPGGLLGMLQGLAK